MRKYIFDFNGTLFQDTITHRRAWDIFMALRGREITDEFFYSYMCGPPNAVILRRLFGPEPTEDEIVAMSHEKEGIYRDLVMSDPALQALTPGAPEMLDGLKARGVPFAIATGSGRDNVDFYMDALRIDRWFDYDHIFYAEGNLPGKPDPTIYRLAMQKLGFDPADVTVVEDALPGVRSAIGAGISRIIAIDTTIGAEAFGDFPQVVSVIHDFTGFVAD